MKKNLQIAHEKDFSEVLKLIQTGRSRAYSAINITMIETYWAVGSYLSRKVVEAGWGKGVVKELSSWLLQKAPDIKGYSAQNLWRMKQLFEIYHDNPKLSALLRELSWTNHCIIMAQCKTIEEKEFYVQAASKAGWASRELENQIKKGPHENPSIGVLLCRNKDDEVVEYALSRTLSPALVAEYEHKLIPKALLKQKLHEWTALIEARSAEARAKDEE